MLVKYLCLTKLISHSSLTATAQHLFFSGISRILVRHFKFVKSHLLSKPLSTLQHDAISSIVRHLIFTGCIFFLFCLKGLQGWNSLCHWFWQAQGIWQCHVYPLKVCNIKHTSTVLFPCHLISEIFPSISRHLKFLTPVYTHNSAVVDYSSCSCAINKYLLKCLTSLAIGEILLFS